MPFTAIPKQVIVDGTHPLARGLICAYPARDLYDTSRVVFAVEAPEGGVRVSDRLFARSGASFTSSSFGRAMLFDGTNDRFTYESSAFSNTYVRYSWMVLLRADAIPSAAKVGQPVVSTQTSAENTHGTGFLFSWDHTSAAFRQAVAHSDSIGFKAAKLTSTLAATTWYVIVGTYDGINIRAYLDGKLEATTAAGDPLASFKFALGANAAGTSAFAGQIADFRFWDRALPSSLIAQYGRIDSPKFWSLYTLPKRVAGQSSTSTTVNTYLQGDRYLNYKDLQPGYTVQSQGFTGSKRY